MNEQSVICTQGLTRYFGAKPAVQDLNLEVPRGSVFGFVGRNGSGKTTTIRMLLGLLQPTRGGGTILGYDIQSLPPEARARIGYLTEEHQLYGWMSVEECGEFQSRFYPRWNEKIFRGVIGHFNLKPAARVKDLSRGEGAGLSLGLTLAPEPVILLIPFRHRGQSIALALSGARIILANIVLRGGLRMKTGRRVAAINGGNCAGAIHSYADWVVCLQCLICSA